MTNLKLLIVSFAQQEGALQVFGGWRYPYESVQHLYALNTMVRVAVTFLR